MLHRHRSAALFSLALLGIAPLGLLSSSPAGAKASKKAPPFEVTWLGHAAFEIVSPGGTRVLIDPFLKGNPKTPAERQDLAKYKPDVILVTHSHQDHLGQAVDIAKASGAPVVASAELIYSLELPDAQKRAANVGGKLTFKDVTVHLVPAMHGSDPGGRPVGFVVELEGGTKIYHTGDTWIFGDMALIQEIHKPAMILLNTGGGPYTQDPATAALAVKKYFKPTWIVPMHFGTFPPLATADDVQAAFKKDKRLVMLEPGKPQSFGK